MIMIILVLNKYIHYHYVECFLKELWLEWLEDEEDDVEFSIDLLNKAVLDYQCNQISFRLSNHLFYRSIFKFNQ